MNSSFSRRNEYFASANGENGFKSYFGEIFNSEDFTRIFILKGGPGTGKSSIIKKICNFAKNENLYFEAFRCSSDPNSLDGVIINKDEISIAVLDGTAPHQRDANIPGAVDELINLGAAWDKEMLIKKRKSIEKINREKNKAYHKAYEYLRFSSVFSKNIKAELERVFDYQKAEDECKKIIKELSPLKKGKAQTRLISSFSKNGYNTLQSLRNITKHYYTIFGKYGSEKVMLTMLVNMLETLRIEFIKIPSPLDEDSYEGVYFKDKSITIMATGEGEIICDSTDFINIDNWREFEEKTNILQGSKELYLSLASEELTKASDHHFNLEKIYTPAMDFSIIDSIYEDLISKIKNILSAAT